MAKEKDKTSWFKKHPVWTGVLIVFVLLFLIGSLNGDKSNTQENSGKGFNDVSNNNMEKEAVRHLGERFEWGDFAYTFNSVETETEIGSYIGGEFYGERADGIFLVVDVTIENLDKETKSFFSNAITITDNQERVFEDDDNAWIYLDEDVNFILEQMQPSLPKRGKMVFDVPQNLNGKIRISKGFFSQDYAYVEWN